MALMEPSMSVAQRIYELRYPDPHEGHNITWPIAYLRSLARLGFDVVHVEARYNSHTPRNPVRRALKRWASQKAGQLTPVGHAHLHLLGGAATIVIARKTTEVPFARRPTMAVIDPATMTTTPEACEAYGQRLTGIVIDAARALRPIGR